MEGHMTMGVLELVILGTSNSLKTGREVMDGAHFSVPEQLSCYPGNEAHSVGAALWGLCILGLVFCFVLGFFCVLLLFH